jgi:hypothetical protein
MNTIDRPTEAHDSEQAELELCISCLQPNSPGTHFCRHCGTPLTSYAATGPFESIFAEGDFVRKATRKGRWSGFVRLMVLVFLVLMILGALSGIFLR